MNFHLVRNSLTFLTGRAVTASRHTYFGVQSICTRRENTLQVTRSMTHIGGNFALRGQDNLLQEQARGKITKAPGFIQ